MSKNLHEAYKNDLELIDNIIIFTEFLKEFVSIILHKGQFENMVEEFYALYSDMLDDYDCGDEDKEFPKIKKRGTKEIVIDNFRDDLI
jgi:hypothetical protein